jgi:ABC-type nitrate/sulfonate/bicarbonate transport system ATPase subunit
VNAGVQHLALTRVIVAHRSETIAMADRIVRLESGRVAGEFRAVDTGLPREAREARRENGLAPLANKVASRQLELVLAIEFKLESSTQRL